MPVPLIVYGLAALGVGLLASGCASSSSRVKNPDDQEGDQSCGGKEYPIKFGDKTAYTLCHEGDDGDGVFQSDSERLKIRDDLAGGGFIGESSYSFMDVRRKLNLPFFDGKNLGHFQKASQYLSSRNLSAWGEKESKIFNKLLEFCEHQHVDLGRAVQLAGKIKTVQDVNSPMPDLSSTVKLNVVLLTASLLSLEAKQDKPQFQKYRKFISETLVHIEAGKLTLADLSKQAKGTPVENLRSISYFPELNKYLLAGKIREEGLKMESSVMMHELYHFYQDALGQPVSFVESEKEAFLLQANILLDDHGLFRKEASKEDLQKFVNQRLVPSGLNFHPNDPLFHALILQFFKNKEGQESEIKPGLEFAHAMLEQFFDSQVSAPAMAYLKSSPKNPAVGRFFSHYQFTPDTDQGEIKVKLEEYLGDLAGRREKKFQDFSQNFSSTGTFNSTQQKAGTRLLDGIFQDTTDLIVLKILFDAFDAKDEVSEKELMKKGEEIKRETLDRLVKLEVLDKLMVHYDGID